MIKRGSNYDDIYNYRNSRHFLNTVKEARRYDYENGKNLVIDFLDPLIVAEKIATTENYKYITIDDIAGELRDGKQGISGIGANGKLKYE